MYISWPCYVCWTWQQLWRNCGAITWSIDKHSSKEKLPAVVVVYVYWGQYIPRRILLYPVYTGYIPITYWSPMFSSNIYQVCAWYILLRTVYAGVYIAPRYQEQYVGARRRFFMVFVFGGGCFFWHSFKFLPGFAVRIKMCSCSWVLEGACGNQQKVVTGKPLYIWPVYAQPKLRGIYQAYTRYILPPPLGI